MSDCTRTEEQLVDFLDGTLSRAEHAAIESHAAHCVACATTLRETRSILASYRSIPDEDAGDEVAERLRTAARTAPIERRARRRTRLLLACVAAALVTVVVSVLWIDREGEKGVDRVAPLMHEAEAQVAAGEIRAAFDTYEQALEIAGEDERAAEILHHLGALHVASEDYAQALFRLGQVVSGHPGYAGLESVLLLRGQALEGLGRREEALKLYRLVAAEFPASRSESLRKIGELEHANKTPGDFETLRGLGYVGE